VGTSHHASLMLGLGYGPPSRMMFGQEPGFITPEVLVELWLASGIQDYAFISSWHGSPTVHSKAPCTHEIA
jgi:hypothetical protein